jgi:GNAT superfamily N-acetyltransferase
MPTASKLLPFDPAWLQGHAVDGHLCAVGTGGEVRAHCSLWWRQTPELVGRRVGAIGHFASAEDEATAALIEYAIARLRDEGCVLAIGPMDGNTWRSYRFVTSDGSGEQAEPPFFLEPANPPDWPQQFEQAGFTPLAEYYSALNDDLSRMDLRLDAAAERLEIAGVRIRSALGTPLWEQLKRIYALSRVAFTRNFLYTELPEADFLEQYAPILPRISPELILLAERDDELVGYLFGVPDFAQAARGKTIDTFLIKTVAILPEPSLRGLGSLLVGRGHEAGKRLGFKRCIHALMHEDNVSRNISNHYAVTMRRYILYSRELAR